MGEFHFSRYPEAEWEPEILKMKASGVQIIATYVIWIHHEETEGVLTGAVSATCAALWNCAESMACMSIRASDPGPTRRLAMAVFPIGS